MRASQPMQRWKRLLSLTLCAGWSAGFVGLNPILAEAQSAPVTVASGTQVTWSDALRETARGGRSSLILVTSSSLPSSGEWAAQVRQLVSQGFGERLLTAELTAETDPARVKSLNVRSIPTVLLYVHDSRAGLKLAAFHQGEMPGAEILDLVAAHLPPVAAQAGAAPRRVVRVQRASSSSPVADSAAQAARDGQVAATTHQAFGAQASAQGSPQSFGEPPGKQMPPSPVKTAPPQQSPPLQAAPPAQPQPVYGYYQPQPVYAAPPASTPVMVQPPAGQVVVQPSPLNVMVAPTPPPQVTYMAPAIAPPMYAPAPVAAPPANAFTAPPPIAAPQPAYAAAPPPAPAYSAPQPAMGAGLAPSMMMTIAPNLLDRFLGGLGRILAERGNPRLRMSAEMPAYFATPAGVAAPPVSPLQAYMAVPNGGDDATEAYLKAYIALCKEKGIKPTLPGMDQPPGGYEPPPTGPVPSPQGQPRKKGWFH